MIRPSEEPKGHFEQHFLSVIQHPKTTPVAVQFLSGNGCRGPGTRR